MPTLTETFRLLSIFSGLAGVIVGWKYRRQLWYYALASLCSDVGTMILKCNGLSYWWLGNSFLLAEFCLVSIFLIHQTMSEKSRAAFHGAVMLVAAAFIFNTVYKAHPVLNFEAGAVLYSILLLLLLWVFYKMLRDIEELRIERSPLFIFCAGFLLYLSGTLIILLARNYLNHHDIALKESLRSVLHILNITKNAALAYSLFLYKRSRIGY